MFVLRGCSAPLEFFEIWHQSGAAVGAQGEGISRGGLSAKNEISELQQGAFVRSWMGSMDSRLWVRGWLASMHEVGKGLRFDLNQVGEPRLRGRRTKEEVTRMVHAAIGWRQP